MWNRHCRIAKAYICSGRNASTWVGVKDRDGGGHNVGSWRFVLAEAPSKVAGIPRIRIQLDVAENTVTRGRPPQRAGTRTGRSGPSRSDRRGESAVWLCTDVVESRPSVGCHTLCGYGLAGFGNYWLDYFATVACLFSVWFLPTSIVVWAFSRKPPSPK